jgi:hypothetical protein
MILRYAYPANVERFHESRGIKTDSADTPEYISGCLRQSRAYFDAAYTAPLDISPLLLYYGATNLLSGALALKTGKRPRIANHGMTQDSEATHESVGNYVVRPHWSESGALRVFCDGFNQAEALDGKQEWPLWELLASIPDLKRDFVLAYTSKPSFVLQIEEVTTADPNFDRVPKSELATLADDSFELENIPGFKDAYMTPQETSKYLVLYRRRTGLSLSTRSISGDAFLAIPHLKGTKPVVLTPLVAMFMALFSVGMLTRYAPAIWHPFVNSDSTGERHAIEQLVAIASRHLPNLVLNEIEGRDIRFLLSGKDAFDGPAALTREQIEAIAKETLESAARRKGIRL